MRRVRGRPFLAARSQSSLCTGGLGTPVALTEPPKPFETWRRKPARCHLGWEAPSI